MKATIVEVFQGGRWSARAMSCTTSAEFYWHAKARNGEIIAQSEGYTRRHDAVRGALRAFPNAKVKHL